MPNANKYKVRTDQSLFDIAIQEAGTVAAVFDLVNANYDKITSLSNAVIPGTHLDVNVATINPLVNDYYRANGILVTTATRRVTLLMDSEGYYLQDEDGYYLTSLDY